MLRARRHAVVIASVAAALLAPAKSHAASLVQVTRSEWAGSVSLPSYMQMYIYVPDQVAAKPPIFISAHSCGSTATGQISNIPKAKAAADAQGFILILPDNPSRNCWDVGTTKALTHDGGGDTHAVAQMVKYTIMKYGADDKRVYVTGGSGGAMLVQALLAVYPEVFRAGVARAGVPAGCWSDGYDESQQWSNNCAGGNTTKTAQQWGDLVRGMYMGYTGRWPRLMTHQGTADTTVSYKNTGETIKQWTNVLMLPDTPTMMDTGFKAQIATYDRKIWKNACGESVFESWSSPGGTHSMPYEEDQMLQFFGLDAAGKPDPQTDCASGGMGSGGMSAGGAAGASAGGAGGVTGGGGLGPAAGAGGTVGAAGRMGGSGAGGMIGTGGMMAMTGGLGGATGGTGMTTGGRGGTTGGTGTTTGGAGVTTGGMTAAGQANGVGGAVTSGGSGGEAGTGDPGGCGCAVESKSKPGYALAVAFALGLLGIRRRKRHAAPRGGATTRAPRAGKRAEAAAPCRSRRRERPACDLHEQSLRGVTRQDRREESEPLSPGVRLTPRSPPKPQSVPSSRRLDGRARRYFLESSADFSALSALLSDAAALSSALSAAFSARSVLVLVASSAFSARCSATAASGASAGGVVSPQAVKTEARARTTTALVCEFIE